MNNKVHEAWESHTACRGGISAMDNLHFAHSS